MNRPLYFGSCFGWFHPPSGAVSRDVAIVLCPPFGYEAVCTHRTYRRLAERLAAAGFPVLRFDHAGTGDSAGDAIDWSVHAAIDAVRAESGARAVSLFGLRLGALLAADAAATRDDVESLVLYAPVESGRAYVRELRAFRMLAGDQPPSEELDAAGFVVPRTIIERLRWPSRRPPHVLVLERDDLPSRVSLPGAEVERPRGYVAMMGDPHLAVVPEEGLGIVVRWLARVHGEGTPGEARSIARESLELSEVREQPLRIGERLFGILTEPRTPGAHARTCVVLLNPGCVHRIGSNRMHVVFARRWAARGVRVLRLDLGGIGDSPPREGSAENDPFSAGAVPDVQLSMRELARTHGVERFVLAGICSGAYVAFRTTLEGGPIAGLLAINPQAIHDRTGERYQLSPGQILGRARRYRQALGRVDKWRKLLRGEVKLDAVATIVKKRVELSLRARAGELRALIPGAPPGPHDIPHELTTIVDRGVQVRFVYSAGDPGAELLDIHAGRAVKKLRQRPNFRIDVVPFADHTFTPIPSQRVLEDLLTRTLDEVIP